MLSIAKWTRCYSSFLLKHSAVQETKEGALLRVEWAVSCRGNSEESAHVKSTVAQAKYSTYLVPVVLVP